MSETWRLRSSGVPDNFAIAYTSAGSLMQTASCVAHRHRDRVDRGIGQQTERDRRRTTHAARPVVVQDTCPV